MEAMEFNPLHQWPVGLGMHDTVWNYSVLSKKRDRLLTSEVAKTFAVVLEQGKRLMSIDHFMVDGALIQAWPRTSASVRRTARTTMARTPTATVAPTRRIN